MIFSASAPFIVLTYLLRGIDLPTIFFLLAMVFLACAAVNAMGIFAGCVPGSWLMRGLVGFLTLAAIYYITWGTLELMREGLRDSPFRDWATAWEFWAAMCTIVLVVSLFVGLLHVMSVALVSPKAFNRMLVPRIYVTVGWAVLGGVITLWERNSGTVRGLEFWIVGSVVLSRG